MESVERQLPCVVDSVHGKVQVLYMLDTGATKAAFSSNKGSIHLSCKQAFVRRIVDSSVSISNVLGFGGFIFVFDQGMNAIYSVSRYSLIKTSAFLQHEAMLTFMSSLYRKERQLLISSRKD
jgi:hypothetical protein